MNKLRHILTSLSHLDDNDVKITGTAEELAAGIREIVLNQSLMRRDSDFKVWFIILTFFSAFLIIGWAGSVFVMMRRINDIANGDHQFLMNTDFSASGDAAILTSTHGYED